MASLGAADDRDLDDSDVTVEISEVTQIDVQPNSLEYDSVSPGETRTESDNGIEYDQLSIENFGSTRIDQIWAETSVPTERPFASDESSGFDTGNFVKITPDDDKLDGADEPRFVNRRDYAEPEVPSFIDVGADDGSDVVGADGSADEVVTGRIRLGEEEYFWAYGVDVGTDAESTDDAQSTGDPSLAIAEDPREAGDGLGTVDFTDGDEVQEADLEDVGDDYALATDVTLEDGGESEQYDILVSVSSDTDGNIDVDGSEDHDGTWAEVLRYNMNPDYIGDEGVDWSGVTGTNDFLMDTGTSEDMLLPGEMVDLDVGIQVPQGVAMGEINTGSVTFFAVQDVDHDDNPGDGGEDFEPIDDFE